MPDKLTLDDVVKLAQAALEWPAASQGASLKEKNPPPGPEYGHLMREYAVVICLSACGIRPEEWEHITFRQLDEEARTLQVHAPVEAGKETKTWRTRPVPVPPRLLDLMRKAYPKEHWGKEEVFLVRPDVIRGMLHSEQSKRHLEAIAKRAGVSEYRVSWQKFNEHCDQRLQDEGCTREQVNRIMGMKSKTKDRRGHGEGTRRGR